MPNVLSITKVACTAAVLGFTLVLGLEAQGCARPACRATNVVAVRVGTILRLSLDGSPTVVATSSPATLSAGYQEAAGPTATVRSNGRWRLLVSAATEAWTPAEGVARPDKPAADLLWSNVSGGDFSSLSTAPAVAATGGSTAGTRVSFYYRTRFAPATGEPGTYTMLVRYTLTSS